MSHDVVDTFHANGAPADWQPLQKPRDPPELLAQLIAKTDMMWRETQRRDGNAVWHSWKWMQGFFVVLGVWIGTVGIGLWLYAHSREVEVMVQTVVYNAEGHFVSLGVPQKLLEHEPEDGQWRDMLEEWVHKKQWRSDEPSATLARATGRGSISIPVAMRPSAWSKMRWRKSRSRRGRSRAASRCAAPRKPPRRRVFRWWEETTIDKAKATKDKLAYTGTFTVGRYKPPTRADAPSATIWASV